MRLGLNLEAARRPFVSVSQSRCAPSILRDAARTCQAKRHSAERPNKKQRPAPPALSAHTPAWTDRAARCQKAGEPRKGTNKKGPVRVENQAAQPMHQADQIDRAAARSATSKKSRWRRILPPIPQTSHGANRKAELGWEEGAGQCAHRKQDEERPGAKQGAAAEQHSSMTRGDGDRALISSDVAAAPPPPPATATPRIHGSQPLQEEHEPSGGHGHDDRPHLSVPCQSPMGPAPTRTTTTKTSTSSSDDASGKLSDVTPSPATHSGAPRCFCSRWSELFLLLFLRRALAAFSSFCLVLSCPLPSTLPLCS